MTVSYTGDVANASHFGIFVKILYKWRGSVYKLVYKELLAYILCYFVINLTYRMVIVEYSEGCDEKLPSCNRWKSRREIFESLRLYCSQNLSNVPLTFMLGFYVSLVVNRWWKQYQLLPWPDSFSILVTALYDTEKAGATTSRILRRTIIRYITLSYCIALRTVSWRLKKRFPSLEHLVHSGIMRDDELSMFRQLDTNTHANKWFMPLVWVGKMIGDGVEKNYIKPPTATALLDEVLKIRGNLQTLLSYDWLSVPLVYTQTVTIATYFYFAAALIGAQWIMPESREMFLKTYKTPPGEYSKLDMLFPLFVVIQFAFFIGWLKVAETLINPFGEDDDDFELNRLIDRHLQVGFLTCDPTVEKPELLKDKFWNEIIPSEIPYTVGAEAYKAEEFKGSAEMSLDVKDEDKIYYSAGVRNRRQSKISRFSRETIYESIRSARPTSSNNSPSKKSHLLFLERFQSQNNPKNSQLKDKFEMQSSPERKTEDINYAEVSLSEIEMKESYGIP